MLFKTSLLAVLLLVQSALVQSMIDQSVYVLGGQGRSCSEVCVDSGMNCNPHVVTDNSPDRFFELGINCTLDTRNWWAHDQPCFVSDPADPNYGKCLGWVRVPGGVMCHSAAPSVQRLCRCDPPSKEFVEFGTGVAGVDITPKEQMVYAHTVAEGDIGVITHFWTTYRSHVDNGTIVRFYVDDEVAPSLRFTPSMASGVGFYDNTAPWGNEMIGKAALDGGWYINVRVPFSKNIRVTVQHTRGTFDHLYVLVRGGVNIPIRVGEVDIPRSARLRLFAIDQHLEPYDWATLADVPAGQSGLMFFITMSAASQAVGFLEGCIHLYTSARPEFPGLILGTGTEDYFDSAWFFNGGQYRLPNSGFTHLVDQPNRFEWSAYRFHINDPIRFTNGMRFVWRNGDLLDASGIKCLIPDLDGPPANPDTTATDLSSYVWVYTWPAVEKASASAVA